MPVHQQGSGYQYGNKGKVYYGKEAKEKAIAQGRAIQISKKTKKMYEKKVSDLTKGMRLY